MSEQQGCDLPVSVSQAQLACALGISQRTVSSALSGSGRVGEALRRRILEEAVARGYRPNRLAAGLRGARTRSLGIVWAFSDPWAGDSGIALDISRRFQQQGFAVYQALHDEDTDLLVWRIDDLLGRRVDALVVQAIPAQLSSPAVRERLGAVAAVTVSRESVAGLPADQVVHDRDAAIREVVDHLAATGRRRPCMVLAMSQESNPPKYRAFVERWAAHGVRETPAMLVDMTAPARKGDPRPAGHPSFEEHGLRHRQAFARQFPGSVPVDCVFCFNDIGALYILRELRDRGCRVPEDVAVVGFNNDQAGAVWDPPLASGDRRPRDVAAAVARLLERRLATPRAPFETIGVPMRFIWRPSAGTAPATGPRPPSSATATTTTASDRTERKSPHASARRS
jgi:LacI family transcriptional regulator